MKERLIRLARPLLVGCMALGAWMSFDITSVIFFGEYEYPVEK